MNVTVLQQNIVWNKPLLNRQNAETAIRMSPGSGLYVLPEMFSTGFATEPAGFAEDEQGETLHWMRQISHETGAALAGSVVVQSQGHYYNRFYFVCPDQEPVWYDKRHLFAYGGEDKHFTAGTRRVVVTYGGIRFLLQVCYDLRFPVFSRNRGDYDAILYVANWPESRIRVWETLLSARAIENQCYIAGVNRVGRDPNCTYCGGSAIIDPYGHFLAQCQRNIADTATATIDLEALMAFRKKFPVLADADPFTIKTVQ